MPALPLDEAGKYVAAAYLVFMALLLVYVTIMAVRLQRLDRQLGELAELAEENRADREVRGVAEGKVFERSQPTPAQAPPAGSGREAEHSGGDISSGGGIPSGGGVPYG
jgi:hypothetical protein